MSQLEEHHFEVLVTVRDGVVVDFDLNGEYSAIWPARGAVYFPMLEKWSDEEVRWDHEAIVEMEKIIGHAKRRGSYPPPGLFFLTWAGHLLEGFELEGDAEAESLSLAQRVRAGEEHDFLDAEDIEDMADPFPVLFVRDTY